MFVLQINCLGIGLCACAQFCPQKLCRTRVRELGCSRTPGCLFFELGNFPEKNQRLTGRKPDFAQIYPQKLWATTRPAFRHWRKKLLCGNR